MTKTQATIPAISSGGVTAYFLWEVGDTIDLELISKKTNVASHRAQLNMRPVATPSFIAFSVPPLSIPLPDIEIFGRSAKTLLKLYDYGVISIRIDLPYTGDWARFRELCSTFRHYDQLLATAQKLYASIAPELAPAVRTPHDASFIEDYYVFTVHEFSEPVSAQDLVTTFSVEVASLLRTEQRPLAAQEVEEALRQRLSYFDNDLSIVEWDSAFVYDRDDAADTIHSILEFANTQLVELRTYDQRLDAELDWIYKTDPVHDQRAGLFSHRSASDRAQRIRLMLIDIRELVDKTNNALKIIGDAFYARLYRVVRARLGLSDWERQIDDKLESVSLIYRFLTDQAQHIRNELLEWIVIILIFVEVIMGFIRH